MNSEGGAASGPAIVLGSRSPQRRMLLEQLVPAELIHVCPPSSHVEPGFDDVHDSEGIERRLLDVVRLKLDDVRRQCSSQQPEQFILCADTVIVAQDSGSLKVLGQPSASAWQEQVREWFLKYYRGRTHWAATAVCVDDANSSREPLERIVRTAVTFHDFDEAMLNWYLTTRESIGKAGGYALQGAASIFVCRIEGSPSNVIGLPLRETREMLLECGWRG